jgi:hypothetical protein
MPATDLTIAEVLNDPLIRQVMQADKMTLNEMKILLQDAARHQDNAKRSKRDVEANSRHFA